jgi:hypothetical protein
VTNSSHSYLYRIDSTFQWICLLNRNLSPTLYFSIYTHPYIIGGENFTLYRVITLSFNQFTTACSLTLHTISVMLFLVF